jgi:hypothetical protein
MRGLARKPKPGAKAPKHRSNDLRLCLAGAVPALSRELVHERDTKRLPGRIAPLRALKLESSPIEGTQCRRFAGIDKGDDSLDLMLLKSVREEPLELCLGRRRLHWPMKYELSALPGKNADKLRNGMRVRIAKYNGKPARHDGI